MKKNLQALLVGCMEMGIQSSALDDGTQWKIVDRLLCNREKFEQEERALVLMFEYLVDEIQAVRRECDDEELKD